MTRRKFKVSKKANQDLDDIWYFVAQRSLDKADNLLDGIQARFLMLTRFSEMGITREELAVGLRSTLVGEYLIFYRVTRQQIEIVRILHGSRDVERIFQGEADAAEM